MNETRIPENTQTMPRNLPHLQWVEWASCAAHAVAFLGASIFVAFVPDIIEAEGDQRRGVLVFGVTMMAMFMASTFLHACARSPLHLQLERLDRASIYLFIAGSYTSLALPLGDELGLLGIWSTAALGAAATLFGAFKRPFWTDVPLFALGWLAVGGLLPHAESLGCSKLALLMAGAGSYTIGVKFFLESATKRFAHLVWHLCVALGSALHAVAAVI